MGGEEGKGVIIKDFATSEFYVKCESKDFNEYQQGCHCISEKNKTRHREIIKQGILRLIEAKQNIRSNIEIIKE